MTGNAACPPGPELTAKPVIFPRGRLVFSRRPQAPGHLQASGTGTGGRQRDFR